MTETLIELRGVRARRGTFELQVEHWCVPAGAIVGVVGPNGSGKTTLLRLLPGLDVPDAGQVRVFGLDPLREPVAVRSKLGWMSDDLELYALPLGKLLAMLAPLYPTWDHDLVATLVERFHLDLGLSVAELSKGFGSRVRLLLAVAFRPRVLVLDEPGTGLDLGGRLALLETLLEAVELDHTAVVISSHQITDVERVADRLLVLRAGRVVVEGATPAVVGDGMTLEETLVELGAAG